MTITQNKNGNWVIPNSFQTPNFLVDALMRYLRPPETVVLIFAIRHILGFQDRIAARQANISLSRFARCGLGQQSIRDALEALNKYNILNPVGSPARQGQLYKLQEDETAIDWDGLRQRQEDRQIKSTRRTEKATAASLEKRGVTSDVMGNVGRNSTVTSDVTPSVTSDVNIKTQVLNPLLNPDVEEGEVTPSNRPNIFRLYEQNIGALTPILADKLQAAEKDYPLEWIERGIEIAVSNEKRSWGYVEAILRRWQTEGFGSDTRFKDGRGKPRSPGAAKSEPKSMDAVRKFAKRHGVKIDGIT